MSYGKNYNTPNYSFGGSMISYFSKPTIDQQVLQNMWNNLKPEESNNFDLGYSYETRKGFISTTLFYSLKNVGGNLYDPVLNMNYQQNTAEARSYGLELGVGYKLLDNLSTNFSFTYTNYAFTTDIQSAAGASIQSKGNQLPDVPELMGNISAVYEKDGYKIAPVLRYLGKRYVDVENKHSVKAHYLVDISLNKEIPLSEKQKLDFSLSATNLLNETYISTISTSETNVAEVGPTYIVGVPRAIFASIEYKY
jgi:iron complex outermembrane receptor protein